MSAHVQWSITHGDEVTVEAGPCYGRMKVALSVGDERFVVTGTRQQLIDQVLSPMALAITSAESAEEKPCELGWGCTDLECPEHGGTLRTGDVIEAEDAPTFAERLAAMADDPASCVTRIDVVSDRWAGPEDAA